MIELSDDPAEALLQARESLSIKDLSILFGEKPKTVRNWLDGAKPNPLIVPALKARLEDITGDNPNPDFTFIDLFAGIGGLRRGFESHGGRCVWTSEWDKFAVQTYKANFHDTHEIAGDITKVDKRTIPDHDVLLAGFPCQPFSLAGVSKKNSMGRAHGFLDETQGTLFFDVAKIIQEKRPKMFLLENVKNLQSHDKGRTFKVIKNVLEELGYFVTEQIIDGIHWTPQHRERIFIAGFAQEVPFTWNRLRLPLNGPKLESILHKPEEGIELQFTHRRQNQTEVQQKYVLTSHLWNYLQNYAKKHRAKGNGFGCSVVGPEDTTRTLSARYHKDGSEILVSRGGRRNPRRLTPRECARLMGFDTPGNKPVKIPVSDTQAYRQFGNAVVVPVVKEVARIMTPHLKTLRKPKKDSKSSITCTHQAELIAS